MRAPDPVFADPRLAVLYDVLDDDRSDLDGYVTIAQEVAARSVIDIGCGTRPEVRDWERWDVGPTTVVVPGGATVVYTRTVTEVALPLVTFETTTTVDDEIVPSTSTLRFRERHEVQRDLDEHGFDTVDVRDAPDRPGKEHVFLARRTRT